MFQLKQKARRETGGKKPKKKKEIKKVSTFHITENWREIEQEKPLKNQHLKACTINNSDFFNLWGHEPFSLNLLIVSTAFHLKSTEDIVHEDFSVCYCFPDFATFISFDNNWTVHWGKISRKPFVIRKKYILLMLLEFLTYCWLWYRNL